MVLRHRLILGPLALFVLIWSACGDGATATIPLEPTPTPTPTPVATVTLAPTTAAEATATPAPTTVAEATATPAPTTTPRATATPIPTSTLTPTEGPTRIPVPAAPSHLIHARYQHTATLMDRGDVLVVGGSENVELQATASTELYDPLTGVWSPINSMAQARFGHTVTVLGRRQGTGNGRSRRPIHDVGHGRDIRPF